MLIVLATEIHEEEEGKKYCQPKQKRSSKSMFRAIHSALSFPVTEDLLYCYRAVLYGGVSLSLSLFRNFICKLCCHYLKADGQAFKRSYYFKTAILGAFAELRKSATRFVMSVCPHTTWLPLDGFGWVLIFELFFFRKCVEKIQVLLKSDKNNG